MVIPAQPWQGHPAAMEERQNNGARRQGRLIRANAAPEWLALSLGAAESWRWPVHSRAG